MLKVLGDVDGRRAFRDAQRNILVRNNTPLSCADCICINLELIHAKCDSGNPNCLALSFNFPISTIKMSSCSFQKTPKSEESLGKSSFSSSASTLAAPPSQDPALRGSCNCGNVTYTSTVLPTSFTNCHCITCRKLSGAPYITFGSYLRSAITFSGTVKLNKSEVAIRSHCAECGSPVSMQYMCEPDEIHLTAGTIDLESVRGTLPKVKQVCFSFLLYGGYGLDLGLASQT